MQDNNIFENSNNFDNSQPDKEAVNQVNSAPEAYDYTRFSASEQVDENDFDLDPELTSDTTENTEQNTSHYANYEEPPIEPIAPIMPKIEKNDYELIEKSNSSISSAVVSSSSRELEILTINSLQSVSREEIDCGMTYYSAMKNNIETVKKALITCD